MTEMRLVRFSQYDYNSDNHIGPSVYINPDAVSEVEAAPRLSGAIDIYLLGPGNHRVPRVVGSLLQVAEALQRGESPS